MRHEPSDVMSPSSLSGRPTGGPGLEHRKSYQSDLDGSPKSDGAKEANGETSPKRSVIDEEEVSSPGPTIESPQPQAVHA